MEARRVKRKNRERDLSGQCSAIDVAEERERERERV